MASKSSKEVAHPHVFLVSFPGQGHVNPLLRLAKLIASQGLLVTLSSPDLIGGKIQRSGSSIVHRPTTFGGGTIRFELLDDERDALDGDYQLYPTHLERIGKRKLPEMIAKHAANGRPVSCLIYNSFIPWVSDVAGDLGIPCAALWVQSCASFSAYNHYHRRLIPFPTETEPEIDVRLPSMPLLKYDEVPSFLHPSSPFQSLRDAILGQFDNLSKNSCILMDTFQELENDVVRYVSSSLCPIIKPIGPLFKYPENESPSSKTVSIDVFEADDSAAAWLDSKPPSSVAFVSFGSIVSLNQGQVTEIGYGLLNSGLSFLWVMRPAATPEGGGERPSPGLPDGFIEKAGEKGKVVEWCRQEAVLAHPSIACFLTHCGWNSTVEAVSCGVPVLAFPQWGDQVTNAKFLVEEFRVGIRMCRGDMEKIVVLRDEVEERLLEATTGPKAAELKESALKWKNKAEEAVAEGGSSRLNLQEFLNGLAVGNLAL